MDKDYKSAPELSFVTLNKLSSKLALKIFSKVRAGII